MKDVGIVVCHLRGYIVILLGHTAGSRDGSCCEHGEDTPGIRRHGTKQFLYLSCEVIILPRSAVIDHEALIAKQIKENGSM